MQNQTDKLSPEAVEAARQRRLASMRQREREGNPLSAEDIAMFEMFEQQAWTHEQRMIHILEHAGKCSCGRC